MWFLEGTGHEGVIAFEIGAVNAATLKRQQN
jgi:hypothetical protein